MRELRDSSPLLGDPRAPRARFAEDDFVVARALVDLWRVNQLAGEVMKVLVNQGLLTNDDNALEAFRRTRASFYVAVQRLESCHALSHDPGLRTLVRMLVGDDAFVHPRRLLRAMLSRIPELVTPPPQDFAYIRGAEPTVTAGCCWQRVSRATAPCAYSSARTNRGYCARALRWPGPPSKSPRTILTGGARISNPATCSRSIQPCTAHHPARQEHIRLSGDCRYQSASEPVVEQSLRRSGYPQVPDWPELLADSARKPERWLSVPAAIEVVSLDMAPTERNLGASG